MGLDRALLHDKLCGDLGVAHPARNEPEHVKFAGGEVPQLGGLVRGRPHRLREPADEPPGDRGIDERVALGNAPHRSDQLIGRRVRQQESARSHSQGLVDVLIAIEGGEDENFAVAPGDHLAGLPAMRARDRLAGFASTWPSDAVLAAAVSVLVLGAVIAQHELTWPNDVLEMCLGLGICASIVVRRAHPKQAALVAACLLMLTALGDDDMGNLPVDPIAVPIMLLAYSLGSEDDVGWPALVMVALLAGMQVANGLRIFNPFVLVAVIGPWAVGLVAGSRRRINDQLAARSLDLAAERELFAAEAVRYERARIARELHDIVAHCLSVMVIQASAGQRLSELDPALAADAFTAIAETVQQAEAEIGRLVELLEHQPPQSGVDGIRLADELVARASAAGLAVSCRYTTGTDGVSQQAADAAYRVIQESLTNALRHAPGAPVDVVIGGTVQELEVSIANSLPTAPASGLEGSGSGRGLAGMRERVHACGGELTAGPLDGGGWRVLARFPRVAAQPPVIV
jgi:signal transduction histidine kinase